MLIELAFREKSYICEFACLKPAFERADVRLSMVISADLRAEACSGERTGKPITLEKLSSIMFFQDRTMAFWTVI